MMISSFQKKKTNSTRSLAIGRSHLLIGNPANALALTKHAHDQVEAAMPILQNHSGNTTGFKTMEIAPEDATFLQDLLKGELQRNRALVEIANLRKAGSKGGSTTATARPLIDRLGQYPSHGVDLENIVPYPPKMEYIPVKPLFLDVAWNYVQYPSTHTKQPAAKNVQSKTATKTADADKPPAKKGWFGFGR